MPIQNSILSSCGTEAFWSAMPRWTSTAPRTASTALANSISMPSPRGPGGYSRRHPPPAPLPVAVPLARQSINAFGLVIPAPGHQSISGGCRAWVDFRSGSKGDLTVSKCHFRSTPRNGHLQTGPVGPFSANNRHHNRDRGASRDATPPTPPGHTGPYPAVQRIMHVAFPRWKPSRVKRRRRLAARW